MKLQGVSVIFALIVLPLILVLTYYIQLQVDTIQMQNEYDKRLLDSTYGAMSAFEINTANEDLSTVSDSLRTIIEASTNVFTTTLATNLGMSNASKSFVEPYIPALLYTLYDGYYISSPTRTPTLLLDSDGNAVTVGEIGITKSGGGYSYREVHTSTESQANCYDCIKNPTTGEYSSGPEGHITYKTYYDSSNSEKVAWQIKYDDLIADEDYGQVLYLKKKINKTDPDEYTTNIDDAEFKIDHILKTYMPYSAKYKKENDFDITVIYTLDNYVSIEGTVREGTQDLYYTKSGYLIPKDVVSIETINGSAPTKDATGKALLLNYNQASARQFIEDGNEITIKINDSTTGALISSGSADPATRRTRADIQNSMNIIQNKFNKANGFLADFRKTGAITTAVVDQFLVDTGYDFSGATTYDAKLQLVLDKATLELNDLQYQLDLMAAACYYVEAEIFSNWVYDNFVDKHQVQELHLVEISGQKYKSIKGLDQVTYDFTASTTPVFDIVGTDGVKGKKYDSITEIDADSPFYTHKLNIIRNSIQYNLNLAMSTYNVMAIANDDYSMPVMEQEEWEKILTNISIVSFMQGYKCGLKKYNNYMIVSSTNNEITVLPEEIYYVEKTEFSNETAEYHRIDCPKLFDKDTATTEVDQYMSFVSKEVKYDKIYDKSNAQIPYNYDHKNLACYDCINDGNYAGKKIFDDSDATEFGKYENLRKAFYIAVGKSRSNIYKMNAIQYSQGYEVIYDKGNIPEKTSELPLKSIKGIEIVLDTLKSHSENENVVEYRVTCSGEILNDKQYEIIPNITSNTTIKVEVSPDVTSDKKVNVNNLEFTNLNDDSEVYSPDTDGNDKYDGDPDKQTKIVRDSIKYVRVIYR